jgi:hypothetical protein
MDPQELIAQLMQAAGAAPKIYKGGSSENYNPMAKPQLPPEYQPEVRPYRGAEIPMSQFDAVRKGDPIQQQIERLLDFERRHNELKAIDPMMAERYKSYGLEGPATDSDMEYVYGPRAVGREMRGGDPLAGSMGMDREDVGRQPNMPPNRRFRELNEMGRRNVEADAEQRAGQDELEMDEQEQRGIYK